jgi:hypothetical protein
MHPALLAVDPRHPIAKELMFAAEHALSTCLGGVYAGIMLPGTLGAAVQALPPSVPLLVVPLLLDELPLLLLPVVPLLLLLPKPPDELPLLPVVPELLPEPPPSGNVVVELLEQPAREAVSGTAASTMSPNT